MAGFVRKTFDFVAKTIFEFVENQISDSVAATNSGQFAIKKLDLFLWSLETPAKYSVDGENSNDGRNLPWLIFWINFIVLQMFRVVFSTILVHFNKKPIEKTDIVKRIKKWRRTLRSIRYRGLRIMRERQHGTPTSTDVSVFTSKQPSAKRSFTEMDYELLDELVNRTFSDTDDHTDSTFMISKFEDGTLNSSSSQSLSENQQSPVRSRDPLDSTLDDVLPLSASESEHQEPNMSSKSNEVTFVSTVDDTEESAFALTEDESSHSTSKEDGSHLKEDGSHLKEDGSHLKEDGSHLKEDGSHLKEGGSSGTPSTVQSTGATKISKESLNVPVDPVDAMLFKFVEMEKNGKLSFKKSGNKKKRNFSLSNGQENVNPRSSIKASKSQEMIDKLE